MIDRITTIRLNDAPTDARQTGRQPTGGVHPKRDRWGLYDHYTGRLLVTARFRRTLAKAAKRLLVPTILLPVAKVDSLQAATDTLTLIRQLRTIRTAVDFKIEEAGRDGLLMRLNTARGHVHSADEWLTKHYAKIEQFNMGIIRAPGTAAKT